MSGTVLPISPPLETNTCNPASLVRTELIPVDTTNNTTTNNVVWNVVDENLLQLLDSKRDTHVTNIPEFDRDDFSSWKYKFLVYLNGLEPYLFEILEDRPFVPMSTLSTSTNPLPKPQKQWSHARRLANQDKRLKSIIISCLPNDVMMSVIKCTTAKAIWTDLILAHKGPSGIKDTKIAALRLKLNDFKALKDEKVNETFTRMKCLLNDLENKGVSIPQAEVNTTFVNSLPKNGRDSDSDVKEDTMSSSEFLADLNVEFHDRALLASQRRFYKRSGRVGAAKKPINKTKETCFAYGKLDGGSDEKKKKSRAEHEDGAMVIITTAEPRWGSRSGRSEYGTSVPNSSLEAGSKTARRDQHRVQDS
ncbi:hypothetical protein Tco_0823748 [Tanacetum coccineum]|uniref:Uncharacterized protein n=1 Tax=Tanacetum coccineum TaxID=301880 RepID=A0ABQ5ANF1_9ASTR